MAARVGRLAAALAAVSVLAALDLYTKAWASDELRRRGPKRLFDDRLVLEFRENGGVAFGLFQDTLHMHKGTFLAIYSGLVAAGLLAVLAWRLLRPVPGALVPVGLGALLAGALGNLIDRLDNTTVTDFIAIKITAGLRWPAFNLADLYMTIGLALCVLALWRAAFSARATAQ